MNKRSRVPITVSLFTVTLGVALALAATIITFTHYSNRQSALTAGRELMERSVEVVRLQTAALIAPIDSIAQYSGDWLDVNAVPKASGHPSRKRLISFVRVMPQIANIYIAYEDGSNYLIGAARNRPKERLEALGAPEGTALLEQIILRGDRKNPLRIQRFLDASGDTLATRSEYEAKYDPRERPWYKLAQQSNDVVRTAVYIFAGSGEPGLTVSKRHARGVVGVDLTLRDIDTFLDSEPQAEQGVLAIISNEGKLLARSSPPAALDNGDSDAVLETLQNQATVAGEARNQEIVVNDRTWLTHVSPIELGAGKVENLAIALPLSDVVGPITRASRQTIVFSILIALGSIPFVWLISRMLSRPLKALASGSNKIRKFELDEPFTRTSKVEEIYRLEVALDQMRRSLQTFGQYVPKALVRQMIERETEPELGGQKRDVTVMFMDLENFTAMSSHLEPEEVMNRMSRYFEIVTQTLLAHDATIDKYIGDAVMAFWNAPNDIADHPRKACEAALAIIEASKSETDSWQEDGIRIRTRIGIHSGDAIIGNVGSSDRLNYTALGSTVNLASRLEGINRDLGSSILVSDDLAIRVQGKFKLRSAGEVEVKGYDEPVKIHELLSREET